MNARRLRGQQPTDRETIKRRLRRREVLDIPGGEMYGQTRHTDAIFFFFLLDGFSSLSLSAQFYRLLVMSRPPLISSSSSLLFPSFLFPDDFPSLSLHIARNTIESGDNKRPSHYYFSLSLLHRER